MARTYYAMGDFVTPVKVSAGMLALNVALNAWFLVGLGMDVEGLALATAITSALNAALLFPGLTRRLGLPASEHPWSGAFARIALAAVTCGAAAFATERVLDDLVGRFLALVVAMVVGSGVYVGVAAAVRVQIVLEIASRFRRKFAGRNS